MSLQVLVCELEEVHDVQDVHPDSSDGRRTNMNITEVTGVYVVANFDGVAASSNEILVDWV